MATFDSAIQEYWLQCLAKKKLTASAEKLFSLVDLQSILPNTKYFNLGAFEKAEIFVALLGALQAFADFVLLNARELGIPKRSDGAEFDDMIRLVTGTLTVNQPFGVGEEYKVEAVPVKMSPLQTHLLQHLVYYAVWNNIPPLHPSGHEVEHPTSTRRVADPLYKFLRPLVEADRLALTRVGVILARIVLNFPDSELDPGEDYPKF